MRKKNNFFYFSVTSKVTYIQHVKNHKIQPHIHKKIMRKTYSTPDANN